ncbi:hypothetical protein D7M11_04570 [Paenibacillus ginsengarvi]|uniref:Uncharacterized protein n=1 Tax=Paenibacillus ginsengarvi TaxID=400777 RepID=A0A3B0CN40_9BACL|nr:hypothetical protein D7M11_04570 [Paenibacillus ginsengarvi]
MTFRFGGGGIIHGNQFTNKLITSFRAAITDSSYKEYEKIFVNGFLETIFIIFSPTISIKPTTCQRCSLSRLQRRFWRVTGAR